MVGRAEKSARLPGWLSGAGGLLVGCLFIGSLAVVALDAQHDHWGTLSIVLGVAAVAAGALAAADPGGKPSVSATFIVLVLAGAFLGPGNACVAAIVSEGAAAGRMRTRPRSIFLINLPAAVIPGVAVALLMQGLAGRPSDRASFYLALAAAATLAYCVSFAVYATSRAIVRPEAARVRLVDFAEYVPAVGLNIVLVLAGASIYLKIGLGGMVFVLSAVFAFTYMTHLLQRARQRSQQYVSLSWGVLAGLMRSLDIRDQRAARHAAAVAMFARDIARGVGMSDHDCELAHTAGLLHDIGRFALSDRVAERGRPLANEDWEAIQRVPELGADMLKDLGMYGPVAEIILAHHERIDGLGYPRGLPAEQIPELAKIIAVAEVYDTLTASDTYRTPKSSFEALRELRRVAGSQLDERYVEVLARLLQGEGVDYRHADAADFDSELDMERRIREAGGGGGAWTVLAMVRSARGALARAVGVALQ